jgi:hypothetical protein
VNTVNCHHCGSRLVTYERLIRGGTEATCGPRTATRGVDPLECECRRET